MLSFMNWKFNSNLKTRFKILIRFCNHLHLKNVYTFWFDLEIDLRCKSYMSYPNWNQFRNTRIYILKALFRQVMAFKRNNISLFLTKCSLLQHIIMTRQIWGPVFSVVGGSLLFKMTNTIRTYLSSLILDLPQMNKVWQNP